MKRTLCGNALASCTMSVDRRQGTEQLASPAAQREETTSVGIGLLVPGLRHPHRGLHRERLEAAHYLACECQSLMTLGCRRRLVFVDRVVSHFHQIRVGFRW
jgi:hypothetical protein